MPKEIEEAIAEIGTFSLVSKAASINTEERTMEVIMTTRTADRSGDIVEPSGLDFTKFMDNPVILWAHNMNNPSIGKVVSVKQNKKQATAKIKFAETDFAKEIFELYAGGFLNAWSIGFQPKAVERIYDTDDRFTGYHIKEAEVCELSAVPVPANAEALTKSYLEGQNSQDAAPHSDSNADNVQSSGEADQNAVKRDKGVLFMPYSPEALTSIAKTMTGEDGCVENAECDWDISPKAFHKSSKELGEQGNVPLTVKCADEKTKAGIYISFEVYDRKENVVTQAKLSEVNVVLPEGLSTKQIHSEESNPEEEQTVEEVGASENVSDETVDEATMQKSAQLRELRMRNIKTRLNNLK